jgi:hypothetical protein
MEGSRKRKKGPCLVVRGPGQEKRTWAKLAPAGVALHPLLAAHKQAKVGGTQGAPVLACSFGPIKAVFLEGIAPACQLPELYGVGTSE